MKHLLFTAENNDAKVNHREASCSQERVHKVPVRQIISISREFLTNVAEQKFCILFYL